MDFRQTHQWNQCEWQCHPDNDSVPNALESGFGGEPNPATAGSNSVALLPTVPSSTGDLVFTFKRKDLSEGMVNLTFQWSTDLTFPALNAVPVGAVSSTNAGMIVAISENSPDAATDLIMVSTAKAAGGKLFGLLRSTVP